MEVLLLGTGSAEGWPNPFCACASCAWALRSGSVRGNSAALLDNTVLLDMGPEVPRAASRAGRDLSGVGLVLLTHAHPDHLGPAALLWRSWAARTEPLVLAGPPGAIDAVREWIGPDDPVELLVLSPGDSVTHRGYTARALAAAHDPRGIDVLAAESLLYDVTGPDGVRLLYATDTGPFTDTMLGQVRGFGFDIVLLEETFGDVLNHGTGHLDLATFPVTLAALRAAGAITGATRVIAVHLGHRNPPDAELPRRLAAWEVEVHDDLTAITIAPADRTSAGPTPGATPGRNAAPRRRLLIGGARSGKSREAERRFADRGDVHYFATAATREDDPEWTSRIGEHRARRPPGWTTHELGSAIATTAGLLRNLPIGTPVLLDCLSLWMSGVLDAEGIWSTDPGTPQRDAALHLVELHVADLVAAIRDTPTDLVLVTNEVGSGVVPATESGRLFRDLLGGLNTAVADVCDEVDLVVAGRVVPLRPAPASPKRSG